MHAFAKILIPGGIALIGIAALLPNSGGSTSGILLSHELLDFGEAALFSSPTKTLEIRNVLNEEAIISLEADCSCVVLGAKELAIQGKQAETVSIALERTGDGELRDGVRYVRRDLRLHWRRPGKMGVTVLPLRVAFREPLAIDASSRTLTALPLQSASQELGFGGNIPIQSVEIVSVPEFIDDYSVQFNSRFNGGSFRLASAPISRQEPLEGIMGVVVLHEHHGESAKTRVNIPVTLIPQRPLEIDPPAIIRKRRSESVEFQIRPSQEFAAQCESISIEQIDVSDGLRGESRGSQDGLTQTVVVEFLEDVDLTDQVVHVELLIKANGGRSVFWNLDVLVIDLTTASVD